MGSLLEYVGRERKVVNRNPKRAAIKPSDDPPCSCCFLPKESHYGPSVFMKASGDGVRYMEPTDVSPPWGWGHPSSHDKERPEKGPMPYSTYPDYLREYASGSNSSERTAYELMLFSSSPMQLFWAMDLPHDKADIDHYQTHPETHLRPFLLQHQDKELGRPLRPLATYTDLVTAEPQYGAFTHELVPVATQFPAADYDQRLALLTPYRSRRVLHNVPWMLYNRPVHRAMYLWALYQHYMGFTRSRKAPLVIAVCEPKTEHLLAVIRDTSRAAYQECQIRNRGASAHTYEDWARLRKAGSTRGTNIRANTAAFMRFPMYLCSGYQPMPVPGELEEDVDE